MKLAHSRSARLRLLAIGAPVILFAAACGGGSNDKASDDNGSNSSSGANNGAVLSVSDTSLGRTLVDSKGMTVYFTNDESDSQIKCVSKDCQDFWSPVIAKDGQAPQISGVSDIATVKRPDGAVQVTLKKHPLYVFSLDNKAGDVHGHMVEDDFDNTHFKWEAALSGDTAAPPAASTAPSTATELPGGPGIDYPNY